MKKIIALFFLTAMLTMSLGCSAEDAWKENTGAIDLDNMAVTGSGVSVDGKNIKITAGGDFDVKGTLNDGMIYVETDSRVKLRLSGVNIINTKGPAIYFANVDKGFITITEETNNYVEDGSEYTVDDANAAIFSNDDLEIKGDGELKVVGNYKHGIASDDDMNIENGNITIESNEHGVKVNNTLHITGGSVNVYTKTGKGLKAEQGLTIDAGTLNLVTADEGIESKGALVINGGSINIESSEDGINTGTPDSEKTASTDNADGKAGQMPVGERPQMPEGAEKGEMPQMPDGEMPQRHGGRRPQMPDGEMPQRPQDGMPGERPEMPQGGMNRIDEEFAKAHSITINGGTIFIKAEGDGIDSNGNLTINGGTVIIDGPSERDNGSMDSDGTMTIAGGTVFTISNGGMMQLPRGDGNQNVVSINVGNQTANSEIVIKDAEGNELITHTALRDFTNILLSHSELAADEEYSVYINGEKIEPVAAGRGFGGNPGIGRGGRGNNGSTDATATKPTASISAQKLLTKLFGEKSSAIMNFLNSKI